MSALRRLREIVTDPDLLSDPDVSRRMRLAFRKLNRAMVLMWRLGLGPTFEWAPSVTGRILVLLHTGRRSGKQYRTPLNFAVVNGTVYCLAGFGKVSDWYRNVVAAPEVEFWMPDARWTGTVEIVADESNRLTLLREVLRGSGLVAYAFGVPPTLDDDRLAELTRDYILVRVIRTGPATGDERPGDLIWVWPVLAGVWCGSRVARRTCRSG